MHDEPLLVHNVAFCELLRNLKGGYENMPGMVAAAKRSQIVHAHHIVMKTVANDLRGPYIARVQAILRKHGIDVALGEQNLTWAIKWDHTEAYVKTVAATLEDASRIGGKAGVEDALQRIAKILNRGQKFRGF
jgi:hypothetical protein